MGRRGIVLSVCVAAAGCMSPRPRIEPPPYPRHQIALKTEVTVRGHSVEGRPIEAHHFPGDGRVVLILGGFHGDEPTSVYVAERLAETLAAHADLRGDCAVVIVPNVNPDGHEKNTRRNARRVDINRNFPTHNWVASNPHKKSYGGPRPRSEPETRIVMGLVQELRPDVIVSMHSINRNRHCNNYDGPAQALAERLAVHNGYPVAASMGYPTPGSFGTWAGKELGIPTITLEMPSGASNERCWAENREALLAILQR